VIRLVLVEIRRLYFRRLVRIVVPLLLALVTVIVVIDGFNSAKSSPAAEAAYQQRRADAYDRDIAFFERESPGGDQGFEPPSKEEFLQNPGDCFGPETCSVSRKQSYVTRTKLREFGIGVGVICAIAAYLLGASAAGAEWSAGTMQSLLYWESRRVRVVLAKVLGLFAVVAVIVVAAEALFSAGAVVAGQLRGTTDGLTSGVWTSHVLLVLRAVAMATFAALLGFAIAFGTRVTAAAVGIGFIYFVALQQLLIVWKPWLIRYQIAMVIGAWLEYGIDFEIGDGLKTLRLSGPRAGLTLAIYAALMVTAATVWFRQRDAT
jgi:ABC-2 type transport system permease protein